MSTKTVTQQLQIDIDHVIEKYTKCNDPEAKKILHKLKKIRRINPIEKLDTVAKILLVADKISDLIDQLPPW